MGNKDNRRGYIGKHRETARHIIGLVADEAVHYNHLHIRIPEDKVMNVHSGYIQKIGHYQLPVSLKIAEHLLVLVAVTPEIPLYKREFQHRDQEDTRHQRKKHALCKAQKKKISQY